VLEKNTGKVKIAFKNFPLQSHEMAFPAAMAAMAAHEQGKFWEFHDRLFAHGPNFNFQVLEDIAREAGWEAGVRGTPTIFINGRQVKQRTPENLQTMIDEELARIKKTGPGKK
jgi:protein-disulfide isomerase